MRLFAAVTAALITLGLAACGGSDTARGPSLVERPAFRATCTVQPTASNRAYDSGYGVVSLADQQKVEVTGATKEEIRSRLAALGVGTKEHPCLTLNVDPLNAQ